MKAYIVSCPDEDHGCDVAFADNANEARRHGSGEMCDHAYIERKAKRAPELDKYAETGVTLKTLVNDHDWFGLCAQCEKQIYGDEESIVWADGDSQVFCTQACFEKFRDEWIGHVNCPAFLKVSA